MPPKQVCAPILSHSEILPGIRLLWAAAAEIAAAAQPGQFVMVRCGEEYDPLLRRPLSIHRFAEGDGKAAIALLFAVVGRGTKWLSRRREGELIDLLGPLGKGFEIHPTSHKLLLVAGGVGVAPLVALAEEAVAMGHRVTLLLGGEAKAQIYPAPLLPPDVEVVVATADGSAGRKGLVTDLLPDFVDDADQVFACGPIPMYHTMAAMKPELLKEKSVQVLLEERMGCGVGMCYGCATETKSGSKLVCREGPVFELREVFWEKGDEG